MKPEHVIVQSPQGAAGQLFLLFHRRGDNPVAMSQIGQWFAREFPQSHVISLGSPHPLPEGGSEWFSEQPCSATRRQTLIDAALPQFTATVNEWQARTGITAGATALIGFSQGGTMILEALKNTPVLAGRAIIFGAGYNTAPSGVSAGTTIHLIHGEDDDVVPLTQAEQAEAWITQAGGDVTLDRVEDLPHAIDERSLELAINHLKYTIPKRYFDEALSGSTPGEDDVITLI